MNFNGLILEYALEGSLSFIAWNDHMEAVLDENRLLEYVKRDIAKPASLDTQNLAQWKKDVTKVRRIILEGVQDHIVSNLHGKESPSAMWQALANLFHSSSDHRKLALEGKLRNIKMQKNDTIS